MAAARKSVRRKPAGKRAQNKELIRARILDAALLLFQSKGFDATTTKVIARKAKIAEGTVFNYFETKDDIALYFLELEVDHAIAAVRKNRSLDKAPIEAKLFALVQAQIEFLEPHERFIGAAFVHALRPGSKIGFSVEAIALRDRYLSFVEELIASSYPPGRRPPLTWFAPQAFWIFYIGALLYWLHDTSPGKQSTLAFLDRSLRLGIAVLQGGKVG
jgi:AcrR family transcriptional regulator